MEKRYVQPWANAQLNSYQPIKLTAKGKLGWKFEFTKQSAVPGVSMFIHLLDEKRALIDYQDVVFALDIDKKKALGFSKKEKGNYLVLADGERFYYSPGEGLYGRAEFEWVNDKKKLRELEYFDVQGAGGAWWNLLFFVPKKEGFIAGVQTFGNPGHSRQYADIYEKSYDRFGNRLWSLETDGTVHIPPVSKDHRIVVAQNASVGDAVKIIDDKGKVIHSLKEKVEPVTLSIGPEDLIYIVLKRDHGTFLEAYSLDLVKLQSVEVDIGSTVQSPVVGSDKTVYLVGVSKVVACKDGKKLWDFKSEGLGFKSATVSEEGKLLLVENGSRILCLDKNGKMVWEFKDKEGQKFATPPVLDEKGKVYIASDTTVFKID